MREFLFVLILTAFYPLARARLANRDTSLLFACWWALAAWLCVLIALFENDMFPYLSLCTIAAVVVAILGARHPHEGSWNFVVIGFLLIMMFPLVEWLFHGRTSIPFFFVLATILTIGCINYVPTRLGPSAGILAVGCAAQFAGLLMSFGDNELEVYCQLMAKGCFALGPWLAWWIWSRNHPTAYSFGSRQSACDVADESGPAVKVFDSIWLDFRDRYGLIWGLRVREQFNRSADNAGWPVQLGWNGLRISSGSAMNVQTEGEMLKTLKGLLQRFMPDQ